MGMKILVIGDFQGVFPESLKRKIRKEKFDLVVGTGDYTGIKEWRPYVMKQLTLAKEGVHLTGEEYFGKKKHKKLLKKDFDAGKKVLIELNKIGKKGFIIFGNGDWYRYPFEKWKRQKGYDKFINKLKNLKNINYSIGKHNRINFIGFGGYMDIDSYFNKKEWKEDDNEMYIARVFRRAKSKRKLFKNLKKTKGERIFILHYPPKGVFDIIRDRKDNPMNGKSAGIGFFAEAIKKYKPKLVICGHMHEYQGMKILHGAPIINPGDAEKGKAAIIEVDDKGKFRRVRFIKQCFYLYMMEQQKKEKIKKFSKISNFQFETEKEDDLDKIKLKIKKEAKEILDKFSKALGKVKIKEKKEKEEFGGMREEGNGLEPDPDFRARMFKNAPHTEGDFIIAEKKKWQKDLYIGTHICTHMSSVNISVREEAYEFLSSLKTRDKSFSDVILEFKNNDKKDRSARSLLKYAGALKDVDWKSRERDMKEYRDLFNKKVLKIIR